MINYMIGADPMMTQIKTSYRRSLPTLLQDGLGAAALMVMLVVALHLPGTG